MKDFVLGVAITVIVLAVFIAANCSNFGLLKFCVFH